MVNTTDTSSADVQATVVQQQGVDQSNTIQHEARQVIENEQLLNRIIQLQALRSARR